MKVIGIDIDGTLAEYSGFGNPIGDLKTGAAEFLTELSRSGWIVCLWSCRPNYEISDWIEKIEIAMLIDYINTSPLPTDSIKPNFNVYLGDEAVTFDGIYKMPKDYFYWGKEDNVRDINRSSENLIPYYKGTGETFLRHFEKLFRELWVGKTITKPIAFLTICSHAKPYSKSYIHSKIREHLFLNGSLDEIDYIHISSAGIIPHEHSLTTPFDSYDWDNSKASPEVRKMLRRTLVKRLQWWLKEYGSQYKKIVVYLRKQGSTLSATREVLESRVTCLNITPYTIVEADELDFGLPWLIHQDPDNCLTTQSNLQRLPNLKEFRK